MTNPTAELLDIVSDKGNFAWDAALQELKDRLIKAHDADDTPQSRGGIRPLHAPIVP